MFSIHIRWYGVLIAAGILLGTLQGILREKRLGLPRDTTIDIVLIGVPAALAGARIYYVLFSLREYINRPFWKVFAVWEGGLAIYGGLTGALLAGYVYARRKHIHFLKLADLAAPGFAIGQAVGRWGNYINQEAFGSITKQTFLKFFPASVYIDGVWHYATFFYESIWCAAVCVVLLLWEQRHKLYRCGDCFFWYVYLYALERGIVEGLRTDSLYLGQIRFSQLLSWVAAIAMVVIWAKRGGREHLVRSVMAPGTVAVAAMLAIAGYTVYALFAGAVALAAALILYRTTNQVQEAPL